MAGVKINTSMFALAREARGISQVELADKIGTSQVNINRWETGAFDINKEAFSQIVSVLDFPESFFFQDGEIAPPTFYRKRDKVSKKILDVVDANINIYRLQIGTLLKASQSPVAVIPNLGELVPQEAAQTLRKKWKVPKGPVENLTEILESNGIMVASFDFQTERVDSRSILTDDKHPVVFTNKTQLGDRLRFTLAYELGHLVMHAYNRPNFDIDPGHNANLFAAEFLMPAKDITSDFKAGVTLQSLADLKTKWKVSMQALLYRASDLELITPNQKRYLLSQFNDMGIRRREPLELDIAKEQPKMLRDLITKYRTRQKMSVKDMAAYFHLHEQEFVARFTNM